MTTFHVQLGRPTPWRVWLTAGLVLLGGGWWESGAAPAPDQIYNVYQYKGLYGHYRTPPLSRWKTDDWIKGYNLLTSISARELWRSGYSHTWPGVTNVDGYAVWSSYGIFAMPTNIAISTVLWAGNGTPPNPPGGICGSEMVYNYAPRGTTNGVWFGRTQGAQTVYLSLDRSQCANCVMCGATTVKNGCVDLQIALGAADEGAAASSGGALAVRALDLTEGLADRAQLRFMPAYDGAVAVSYTNNVADRIVSRLAQTQISDFSSTHGNGYAVEVKRPDDTFVSRTEVTQQTNKTLTVRYSSAEQGQWLKQYEPAMLDGHAGIRLVEKDYAGTVELRATSRSEWQDSTNLYELVVHGPVEAPAYQEKLFYSAANPANPLWRKTRREVGAGADVQVATWGMLADGRTEWYAGPQGDWTCTTSNDEPRPLRAVSPWQNAPLAAHSDDSQCRVSEFSYAAWTNGATAWTLETETQKIAGVVLQTQTTIQSLATNCAQRLSQTNIVTTANGTQTTSIVYDGVGLPSWTVYPDNSLLIESRWSQTWTNAPYQGRDVLVYQSFRGSPDQQHGVKTYTVTDKHLDTVLLAQTFQVRNGQSLLTSENRVLAKDPHWRITATATLTGTNTTTYSCCGISQTVDAEGNATDYTYDELKRQVTVSRAGVTTSNVNDAADRVIATYRFPDNNPAAATLVSSSTYNTAGELTASTDALNHTTTYSNWVDAAGYVFRQTTYPDGSYRREQSYRDGQLAAVTGSAVHSVSYSNRVETVNGYGVLVTRETKLDGTTEKEWTETWTDGNGRTLKTVRSGDVITSQSGYNTQGQLEWQCDADGVTNRFGYNAAGEQIVTLLADRITSNATSIATAHGTTVLRRETWQINDSGTFTLVSTSDSTGDGLRTWQTSFNLTSSSTTVIDAPNQQRTVTVISPDGSQTISVYQQGRLQNTTRKDAQGAQLSAVSYQCDALGRVVTNSDTRTVTVTAYNAADQQISVTVSNQTTGFAYNSRGQVVTNTLPDGAHTYVAYLPTGEVSTNWGDRTYPVAYTFDYAGRMQTMTTFTNFNIATPSGAATTKWIYADASGQLKEKWYADSATGQPTATNKISYTYTDAGRLQTRTWARGVVTTYGYNIAGDLWTVAYTDGTPWVTNTYNRLGRRIVAASVSDAVSYSYNDAGQLLTETHTGGVLSGMVVSATYDSLLRRDQLSVGTAGPAVRFAYDNASRLSSVSAGTLSASYTYLANAPTLVNSIVFRTGGAPMMTTSKTYDNLNRLTKIESTTGGRSVSSHTYQLNNANQRTKRTDADGTFWDYGYDSLGQVTSAVRYWAAEGTNAPVPVAGQQYGFLFDDIGNRKTATMNSNVSAYTANLLNQYTQRSVPGLVDIIGSAASSATVTVSVSGVTNSLATRQGAYFHSELALANTNAAAYSPVSILASMTYNGTNVVVTNTGSAFLPKTPEIFNHDSDGSLTNDGRWAYTWDAENRLIAMETVSSVTNIVPRTKLEFAYDAGSRRIQKKVYSWNTDSWLLTSDLRFVYDGWNLLAEVGTTGSVVRSYVWGLDLSGTEQGAGGIGGLLWVNLPQASNTQARGSHFVAFDGNGNVAALLNAQTAQTSAEYEYGPFGETIRATGPAAAENVFRFSAKYTDLESGLVMYPYRPYLPPIGLWLSRDPIWERGGLNLFGFVVNDPINDVDPDGRLNVRTLLSGVQFGRSFIGVTGCAPTGFGPDLCLSLSGGLSAKLCGACKYDSDSQQKQLQAKLAFSVRLYLAWPGTVKQGVTQSGPLFPGSVAWTGEKCAPTGFDVRAGGFASIGFHKWNVGCQLTISFNTGEVSTACGWNLGNGTGVGVLGEGSYTFYVSQP